MSHGIAFLVDDDAAIRDALAWLLRSRNIASRAWEGGEAFLADYHTELRGVIVLDIRMTGMSGLELFDRLLERNCRLPVIFLTGHGDVPQAVQALKKGAFDFIEKPFNDNELTDRVLAALDLEASLHGQAAGSADLSERIASLTEREREIMMSHSFETYQILKRTPGLAQIAELAAFHHERLNGHGYPFHTGAASITPEMRIIQVADVFQALAQRRPYRAPMAIPQILAELRHMVADDSLDPAIFALVESDAERCHQLAVSA